MYFREFAFGAEGGQYLIGIARRFGVAVEGRRSTRMCEHHKSHPRASIAVPLSSLEFFICVPLSSFEYFIYIPLSSLEYFIYTSLYHGPQEKKGVALEAA